MNATRRGATPALVAAIVCALLAGCGSSPGSGGGTAGSGSTATHTSTRGSSLKVDGTPKFGKPAASEPVHGGVVQIAYRNFTIQPDVVRVKVGSTIRWTNYDPTKYNVTSVGAGAQRLASGEFGEGQSFQVKLTRPGIIHYECTNHPVTMNGTIEVIS